MQKFVDRSKLRITVCHFPPGTSKWNKVEHRLLSYISMNWRGRPLTDYQTVVSLIAATTTRMGLIVKVRLDKKIYQRGIKVSAKELRSLRSTVMISTRNGITPSSQGMKVSKLKFHKC